MKMVPSIGWLLSSTLLTLALGCADEGAALDASDVDAGVDSGVGTDSGFVSDSGRSDLGASDTGRFDADVTDAITMDAAARDVGPLLDSGCVASRTAASPQYTPLAAPGRPRAIHAAARLPNGQVLVAGGFSDGVDFDPDVEIFDPSNDAITAGDPRPVSQAYATAVPLSDGRIFVSSGPGLPALLYDQASGWTKTSTAPDVYSETFVPLPDNRVLVVGGFDVIGARDEVYVYDPAADTWSLLFHLLTPRGGAAAVALADGRILVVAGALSPNVGTDTSELLDVAAATSLPGPLLLESRIDADAVLLLDRRVLVLGGEPINGLPSEIYDPATNAFEAVPAPSPPRKVEAPIVRLCDGRVAQVGGRLGNNPIADSTAWIFDPVIGRWSATTATMPTRQSPSATLLLDGRVLVFGGSVLGNGPQPLSAHLFVPDVPSR